MKHLVVFGQLDCEAHHVAEVKAILDQVTNETVSKEDGCLSYQYFNEIGKPASFATLEKWENEAAEAAHWETAHMKAALKRLIPLVLGEVRVFKYFSEDTRES